MKVIVFIILFFFFVLPVGFFIWLIGKGIKNTKKEEWTGEVINKLHNTKDDDEIKSKVHHFYTVVVKTDKGFERKLAVSKEEYDDWNIGDKARKEKGKLKVEKIS